jgi:hypothetical protein
MGRALQMSFLTIRGLTTNCFFQSGNFLQVAQKLIRVVCAQFHEKPFCRQHRSEALPGNSMIFWVKKSADRCQIIKAPQDYDIVICARAATRERGRTQWLHSSWRGRTRYRSAILWR